MNESRSRSASMHHRDVRLGFIAGGLLMTAPLISVWQAISHDLRYGPPGGWAELRLLPALTDLGVGWVPLAFGAVLVGISELVRRRRRARIPHH